MYLIDTNIISEVGKGRPALRSQRGCLVSRYPRRRALPECSCHRRDTTRNRTAASSKSATSCRAGNWLQEILTSFGERVLPIDERVAQVWGRMNAREPLAAVDSLLAATAEAHGMTLVTRNLKDIKRSGVRCLNPFEPAGSVE